MRECFVLRHYFVAPIQAPSHLVFSFYGPVNLWNTSRANRLIPPLLVVGQNKLVLFAIRDHNNEIPFDTGPLYWSCLTAHFWLIHPLGSGVPVCMHVTTQSPSADTWFDESLCMTHCTCTPRRFRKECQLHNFIWTRVRRLQGVIGSTSVCVVRVKPLHFVAFSFPTFQFVISLCICVSMPVHDWRIGCKSTSYFPWDSSGGQCIALNPFSEWCYREKLCEISHSQDHPRKQVTTVFYFGIKMQFNKVHTFTPYCINELPCICRCRLSVFKCMLDSSQMWR